MLKSPEDWTDEETEAWIRESVRPDNAASFRQRAAVWRLVAMGLEEDPECKQLAWRISRVLDQRARKEGEWQ